MHWKQINTWAEYVEPNGLANPSSHSQGALKTVSMQRIRIALP